MSFAYVPAGRSRSATGLFSERDYADMRAYFAARPDLSSSPTRDLPALARRLGVGALLVKDETARFGLNAFKLLGARYAIDSLVADRVIEPGATLACASEGNHGRAVARAARASGCQCLVFMAGDAAEARVAAIASEGATVIRVEGSYDDAVRIMSDRAAANGWTIVSDTSWPGYEDIPKRIMLGYTRMMDEVAADLASASSAAPFSSVSSASSASSAAHLSSASSASSAAHLSSASSASSAAHLSSASSASSAAPVSSVFVQGGVGGLLCAVASWCALHWPDHPPAIVCVEPVDAACLLASARAGRPVAVEGPLQTTMAGLRNREVSPLAFEALLPIVDAYLAIDDRWAHEAMRHLARPLDGDPSIAAGASGAAALGGLAAVLADPALERVRHHLQLGPSSRVLVLVTEGATDPDLWSSVVAQP